MKASNTEDMNTPGYLERVKNIVMENLRKLKGPPSVQMTGTEQIYYMIFASQPISFVRHSEDAYR